MIDLTPKPSWGEPFTADDWEACIAKLHCTDRDLWTVIRVETAYVGMCGFRANKVPVILYERHVMWKRTEGEFAGIAPPDLYNPNPGGYGTTGAQWAKLEKMVQYDEIYALQSCSWGIGQVMGFNYRSVGWGSVHAFVRAMCWHEGEQLHAMCNYILNTEDCAEALRTHKWAAFARLYNGADFQRNHYDDKLAQEYESLGRGLPDITVRTAQMYLRYAGFDPGPVDGMLGARTVNALRRSSPDHVLPQIVDKAYFTPEILRALRRGAGFPDEVAATAEPSSMMRLSVAIEAKMQELAAMVEEIREDVSRWKGAQ